MNSKCASAPLKERTLGTPGLALGRAGFTLIELVAAVTLFAFIVIYVLADREKSLQMSGEARIIQTVRYLAALKIDEIRHDPEEFGEGDGDTFEDLNNDWQDFSAYAWRVEIRKILVIGSTEDSDVVNLFPEDEDEDPPENSDGEPLDPRYVRELQLTVTYEPDGVEVPELSIVVKTYLPPEDEEDAK